MKKYVAMCLLLQATLAMFIFAIVNDMATNGIRPGAPGLFFVVMLNVLLVYSAIKHADDKLNEVRAELAKLRSGFDPLTLSAQSMKNRIAFLEKQLAVIITVAEGALKDQP